MCRIKSNGGAVVLADESGMEFPAAAGIPSCLFGQPHSCYVVSQSWVNLPSLCRSRLWVVQMAVSDYHVTRGGREGEVGVDLGEQQSATSLVQPAQCGNVSVTKPRMSGCNPVRFCYNRTTGYRLVERNHNR